MSTCRDLGLEAPVRDNFQYASSLFHAAVALGFRPDDLLDLTGWGLVELLATEAELRNPPKVSTATCTMRCKTCGLYDCGVEKCACDKDRFTNRFVD